MEPGAAPSSIWTSLVVTVDERKTCAVQWVQRRTRISMNTDSMRQRCSPIDSLVEARKVRRASSSAASCYWADTPCRFLHLCNSRQGVGQTWNPPEPLLTLETAQLAS